MAWLTRLVALLTVVALAPPAAAQYRIGMSAAITGPASSTYAPTYEAYKVYFQRVNDAGGIHGQKVEIAYEDDRGEPQRAAANAKKLGEGTILMVNASTSATYKPFMTERSEEHTSELQSHHDLVCRLLLEKKKKNTKTR